MANPTRSPVHRGLFRTGPSGEITLLGGWSPSASLAHFPRRDRCPYTGAEDVVDVDLPQRGTIWAFTEVTAAPPGYSGRVPYGIGVVGLEVNGTTLRVVTRLVDGTDPGPRIGQQAVLVADEVVDSEGEILHTWAFQPVEAADRTDADDAEGRS